MAHVQVGDGMAGDGSGEGLTCKDEQLGRHNRRSINVGFIAMIGQFL
jgi:hypothetical protein